jgi:hypothetical protein
VDNLPVQNLKVFHLVEFFFLMTQVTLMFFGEKTKSETASVLYTFMISKDFEVLGKSLDLSLLRF